MTDTLKPLTSAELVDLKAKAKAATQGEWFYRQEDHLIIARVEPRLTGNLHIAEIRPQAKETNCNGEHIAAANPETILRLIAMIELRDKQIDRLRIALANLLDGSERHIFSNECQAERDTARGALAATGQKL